MKTPTTTAFLTHIAAGFLLCLCLCTNNASAATSLFFDANGPAAGYGGSGSWDGTNWATASGGTLPTGNWVQGDFARFFTTTTPFTITVGNSFTNVGMFVTVDGVTLTITATNANGNLSISTNGGVLVNGSFLQGFLIGATTTAGTANLIINAPVVGPGGIEQEQSGALYLLGTNTYAGGTEITGGQVTYYNNNSSFGTGAITVAGTGQALVSTASTALTIPNKFIFPTANFTLNLAGGNPVAGAPGTTFSGTFTLPSSGTTTLLTSVTNTQVIAISGVISGASALAVGDNGELILSAANTYSGGTFVNSGILDAKVPGAIPGKVTVTNGMLVLDAPIQGNITVTGGSVQMNVSNAMSGFATLTLPSASTNSANLNFTGTNNILTLNFGTNSMAAGTWGAAGSGATFTNSAFTGTGILYVSVSTATNFYWDANGSDASAQNNGSGGGNGNWDNATPDWWTGGASDTAWQSGYIANFGGTAGTVTVAANVNPDALLFTTPGYVINNTGGSAISVSNPVTLIGIPSGTTTIACPIAGQGLDIFGPGTLVLSGSSTYTGNTLVSNGTTLSVNTIADSGISAIGYGPMLLQGGTLSYTGASAATTARPFPVPAGAAPAINLPAGSLTLNTSVTSSGGFILTKTGNGTLTFGGTSDNAFCGLNLVGGTVILNKTVSGHSLGNPVTVGSGTLLQLSGSGYGQEIFSGAPVTINSGGLFDLNGQSTPLSVLTLPGNGINNGVLTNSSASTGTLTATTVVLGGNTTINSTGPITLGGTVQGSFAMTQAGSGLLTLTGANTFNGGLNINAGTSAQINNGAGAGQGTIAMAANSTLGVNISNGTLSNPVNGPSSAIINFIETSNQNTTVSSPMTGFTGTINCPANAGVPGSTSKIQMTSTAFTINPGANINVAAGGTLYVVNPGVVIPCALNLYGLGNIEPYGALRIEKGALISGPVTLFGNTTIGNGVSGAANLATISGAISGAFGVAYTAEPGTIVLSGANTYTGTTTLTGCVVQAGSAEIAGISGPFGKSAASNPGSIVFAGGQLQYSSVNNNDYSGRFSTAANQKYNIDANGRTVTFATPLSSVGGSLTSSSSSPGGMLVLSTPNTYTGATTNASGTLQLACAEIPGTSGPLGLSAAINHGSIFLTGGILQYTAANGANDYSGRFSTNTASESFNIDVNGQNVVFASGLLSTNGSLTVSSTAAGGSLSLRGTNVYTGATTINQGGTLIIAGTGCLGTTNGVTNYAGAITDNGTFNYASSANQALLGAISGIGSLIQSGAGTLTLSNAANAYSGGTTVSNGILNVNATGFIPGNVTVAGGVLLLGSPSALDSAAILTLAATPAAGTVNLNFSGVQTVSALNFGSTSMPPGTYGATGNGSVTYQNAAFTGGGILNVVGQGAYWDPAFANAAPGSGGPGSWDASAANWFIGSADTAWVATNIANFAGSAGTVTLNANVAASGLTFATPGYDLSGGATLTLSGLASNGTPIISIPAGNTTIDCALATATSSNTVIVAGPGTLALTGPNAGITSSLTVAGGATLSANSIADSGTSAIGVGTSLTLFDGNLTFTGSSGTSARTLTLSGPTTATLTVPGGNTLEWDGQIHSVADTAAQNLTFTGGGTLILGGVLDNSSLFMAINAGTVIINKNSTSTVHGLGGGVSTVASGAELQLSGAGNFDLFSGCVLTVASGGVFDLNGQSDSFSTLTLSGNGSGGGALINSSVSPCGITNGGSGIVLAGNATISGNGNILLASTISGNGMSLTYNGSAQLILGGANTYSGGLNVGANSTVALSAAAGGGIGPVAVGDNGTLIVSYTTAINVPNTITGGSSATIQVNEPTGNTRLSGSLSGFSGTINCESATNNNGQLVIDQVYNGLFPISASATWHIMNGATLDLATPFTVDPAAVVIDGVGNNQIFGALRLDACNQQGNVLLNGPNCLIGDGNTTGPSTISGIISDNGNGYNFTKVGANATIVLTAANTYSGGTIVNNGTLAIGATGSIASSSGISLTNGTALDVSAVSGGYSLGSSQGLTNFGAATIVGSLNLSSGAPLTLLWTNNASVLTVTNGTLTLGNNPVTVTILGSSGPLPGTYPLITGVNGANPGLLAGSIASSPLTVNNQIVNTIASLAISNNTLYLNIVSTSPTILSQTPVNGGNTNLLYAGAHSTFSVAALSAAQYLWYTNNVLVGGVTNSTLTLTNIQGVSLATVCIATNAFGTASATWNAIILPDPTNPYPMTVLADNPLGYWRLNEPEQGGGDPGVLADDYWGGNVGIYTNVNLGQAGYTTNNVPDTDPAETSALFGTFAGVDSDAYGIPGINFASPASTSPTFSVEAWVNGFLQTTDAGIVSLGYGGGGEQFNLDTGSDSGNNHRYRFFVRDAAGNTHGGSSTILPSPGSWQHLVGVCDESNGVVTLYVNGVVAASGAVSAGAGLLATTRHMIIGSRPSNSTTNVNNNQFVGAINDVAVYNYALSASQVVAHYVSAGVPPSFSQVPPAAVTINAGATLTLPAIALGTPGLTNSWFDVNGGTNLLAGTSTSNTLNSTLIISNVPASLNGDTLQLTVSNLYGSTNISVALTVNSALAASVSPTNVAITADEPFTFTVQAVGTAPITYQWYAGSLSTPILNATNASFMAISTLGDSIYICKVTDLTGSTNLPVTLTGLPYLALNWNGIGWAAVNQSGTYSTTAFNNNVLTLTDGGANQVRGVFFDIPQYIGAFEASFTYQAGGSKTADGIAFVLQNDARGVTALGGGGGLLGVGTNNPITPSAELELNLYTGNSQIRGYAYYTNGLTGHFAGNSNYTAPGSINLASGNPINIALYYNQGMLSLTITDTVALISFSTNLNVGNLPASAGGNFAYVGFTGSSGGSTAVQTITGFKFLSLMPLTAQLSGTNMILTWPADVSLYQLQSNTNLAVPNWVDVTNSVFTIGNQNQVTVPVSATQAFYRLQLQ